MSTATEFDTLIKHQKKKKKKKLKQNRPSSKIILGNLSHYCSSETSVLQCTPTLAWLVGH